MYQTTVNGVSTGERAEGQVSVHTATASEPFSSIEEARRRFDELVAQKVDCYLYVGDRVVDSWSKSYDEYCVRAELATHAPDAVQADPETLEQWLDAEILADIQFCVDYVEGEGEVKVTRLREWLKRIKKA